MTKTGKYPLDGCTLLGVAMDFKSQHAAHTFYNNPEAQQLVAQARRELDPKRRQALYTQLQRIESRDASQLSAAKDADGFARENWHGISRRCTRIDADEIQILLYLRSSA